eukprot:TRINITY_DN17208_c0_g1_i1.p1 TRINITY_DN17208_c0_g1~~TRINITY_DN17208_c0_g1_i1.p1  ORF type:complete len:107 (-),score=7.47 TRINITY_DN17208_c0_g1_i1:113-433(-)
MSMGTFTKTLSGSTMWHKLPVPGGRLSGVAVKRGIDGYMEREKLVWLNNDRILTLRMGTCHYVVATSGFGKRYCVATIGGILHAIFTAEAAVIPRKVSFIIWLWSL